MQLKLEINQNKLPGQPTYGLGSTVMLVTPPIDESFWLYRVAVSDKQAIVGFPKFFTIGIGFQVEEDDWNTNLPYSCPADEIFRHISRNKGDESIPDERCLEAIRLIQDAVTASKATKKE